MCKACSSLDGAEEIRAALHKGDREKIDKAMGVETQSYVQDSYSPKNMYIY